MIIILRMNTFIRATQVVYNRLVNKGKVKMLALGTAMRN
ncbi:hypothetical protein XBJ2_330005 [Xenorhabdus bovienii str. Jollieti]|nr:hypothetical protein XBJ2_330005 [Xenorhabdus bovienii str. Jollieti]